MIYVLTTFLFLSFTGFILSVAAHIASIAGIFIPGGNAVMGLHGGIFIVWIPTVIIMMRVTKGARRKDSWKIALSGCPPWMRGALYVLFAYAFLNFFLFASQQTNKGHDKEQGVTAETIRGFSGHWMLFYGTAFATIYSAVKSPSLLRGRKCPNGH
ncbi:MAG TPA: hypothetical protein VFM46_15785, partial [Pseudomonadales bacterium]|nr:hypothetical protein [Pseudomonadales bacterium]